MATNWLDIIPAIQSAGSVPLRSVYGDRRAIFLFDLSDEKSMILLLDGGGPHPTVVFNRAWRVDLDDPQGFAYAFLSRASRRFEKAVDDAYRELVVVDGAHQEGGYRIISGRLLCSYIHGPPSGLDKLVVARALAEVAA